MHPTPTFRWSDPASMLAFVSERAFATLIASLDGALVIAQAPVIVGDASTLLLHLSRANPIAKALPHRVTVVVHGPDAYVSPDWYRAEDQVPTWNYLSVEIEGELVATDDAMLRSILDRQSAVFEARVPDKRPWTTSKMTPAVLAAKLAGIVGASLTITAMRGTSKLSQNKSEADREGVIAALGASSREMDRAVAQQIQNPPSRGR